MKCFCGCGQSIPRFPLGLRSINKRGARHLEDVGTISMLQESGMESPNAEAFVADGREVMEQIALALHEGEDPGPNVEAASRDFLERTREGFTHAALGRAIRASGVPEDQALAAITNGELDPFA